MASLPLTLSWKIFHYASLQCNESDGEDAKNILKIPSISAKLTRYRLRLPRPADSDLFPSCYDTSATKFFKHLVPYMICVFKRFVCCGDLSRDRQADTVCVVCC